MSTGKKWAVALGLIVSFVIILGMYLYNQPENKYIVHAAYRTLTLSRVTKKMQKTKLCSEAENKVKCFNSFVLTQGGIQFSVDIPAYFVNSFTVCGSKDNAYCIYELNDVAINQLQVENLWISKNISHSDVMFSYLLNMELDIINKMLREFRKKLVTYHSEETDPAKKTNALNFITLVDAKIQLMQRSRLTPTKTDN